MRQVTVLELLTAAVTVTTSRLSPRPVLFRAFCGHTGNVTPIPEQHVRAELDRILATKGFSNAGRLSKLLRYVVEKTLAGETDQLKEYAVGVEVFDRDGNYDPRLDSIVRVEAGRLRSRLDQYYNGEGAGSPIRINLPRGGYSAQFEQAPAPQSPPAPQAHSGTPGTQLPDGAPTRDRLALRRRSHGDVARQPRSTSAARPAANRSGPPFPGEHDRRRQRQLLRTDDRSGD